MEKQNTKRRRWFTFTYIENETKYEREVIRNTNLKISFEINNSIGKILYYKNTSNKYKYNKSGIFKLTCPSCGKDLVGQTGKLSTNASMNISSLLKIVI